MSSFSQIKIPFHTVHIVCLDCLVSSLQLEWFRAYVHRQKSVFYGNTMSDRLLAVTCEVPQGSIVTPRLFVLFVNYLPNVIEHCKIVLYADDMAIMFSHKSHDSIKQSCGNL